MTLELVRKFTHQPACADHDHAPYASFLTSGAQCQIGNTTDADETTQKKRTEVKQYQPGNVTARKVPERQQNRHRAEESGKRIRHHGGQTPSAMKPVEIQR